jgi:DNA-binding LacI/PurR family transcriptional regulator
MIPIMFTIDKNKTPNLTIELAHALRRAIQRGKYSPGQMIPSERELSDESGLSRTTVRRAIQLLVDEGVLYRVPGSGTYVGQERLNQGVHEMLGVIVPTLANPYYAALTDAIEQEANLRGYQVLVGQSDFTKTNEANYLLRYADNPAVKGALVVPNVQRLSVDAYRYMIANNTPFIFVSRSTDEVEADIVVPDRKRGARDMVKYLIELGHRKIGYIRGIPPYSDSHFEGYRQALREADIQEDPDLIISLESDQEEAGRKGIELLLDRGTTFSAIFARNDITANGAMQELKKVGLRIPDDVSVAGVDNIAFSAHLEPPLTTIDTNMLELGRLAVDFLLDRVEGQYAGPPRRVTIAQSLIKRASCGSPREGELDIPMATGSRKNYID